MLSSIKYKYLFKIPRFLLHKRNRRSYTTTQWAQESKPDTIKHDVEKMFKCGLEHHHICNTAFPIAHTTTIKPYRVPRYRNQIELRNTLQNSYGNLKEMMIYAHIPFCATRCQFCEYTVIDPKAGTQQDTHNIYFNHLLKEFDFYSQLLDFKNKTLTGFDIGGGTPSIVSSDHIHRLYDKVTNTFNHGDKLLDVSIETTPKIAANEPDKIKSYKKMGINRISFGLQTTDFTLAKKLGRTDANYVNKAVDNIRNAGFESLNIDLMYGFPIREGAEDKWRQTVLDTINLEPDHITLYRMRYKGTKMSHVSHRVDLQQVNRQETEARLLLTESGYTGWIGKNTYSKINDGRNGCSDYLNNRVINGIPYIGIGLGAQSYSHNSLHYNLGAVTKNMYQYIKSIQLNRIPIQDLYYLSKRASVAKFISVSFYYGGIDLNVFESIFHCSLESIFYDEVQFLLKEGLMIYEYDNIQNRKRLQMTINGKKHFGGICALFYTPSIQSYLLELSAANQSASNDLKPVRVDLINGTPKRIDPINGTQKNDKYEFGNILFSGACNQKCYFCIGKQLDSSLSVNNLSTFPPENLDLFIKKLKDTSTKKVIFTGTTTDPLLYKYNKELIKLIRDSIDDVHISIHTNAVFAMKRIDIVNLFDSITISYNSFNPKTFKKIHGTANMPNLLELLKSLKSPVKLSCIITEENIDEIMDYIDNCNKLGIKRIAMRHLFGISNKNEKFQRIFSSHYTPTKYYCKNPIYNINGVEVTHWIFEHTSGKSLNLFSNGTISHHYLLSNAESCDQVQQYV